MEIEQQPEQLKPWGLEKKQFITLMHASQLAGYITAGLGLVIPLIMWLMFKDEDEEINVHGKEIVNWSISLIIYVIACVILVILLVGIPLLIVLAAVGFVFPIIGAIKASNGEFFNYPLTINFIR